MLNSRGGHAHLPQPTKVHPQTLKKKTDGKKGVEEALLLSYFSYSFIHIRVCTRDSETDTDTGKELGAAFFVGHPASRICVTYLNVGLLVSIYKQRKV